MINVVAGVNMVLEKLILLLFLLMKYSFVCGMTTTPDRGIETQTTPINCECVNEAGLKRNLGVIQLTLTNVSNRVSNLTNMPNISSKLRDIFEAIENRQFSNESIILESQKSMNDKIDKVLEIINGSITCTCSEGGRMLTDNEIILGKLKELRNVSDMINNGFKSCDKGMEEIKTKLDIFITSELETNTSLSQDLKALRTTLQQIEQNVSIILGDTNCKCVDQFKIIYDKISEGIDEILDKLNKTSQQNNASKNDSNQEILNKMDEKLDTIINSLKFGGPYKELDCLKSKQFEEEMPQYCGDPRRKKGKKNKKDKKDKEDKKDKNEKVKPWELPKNAWKKLISNYEGCIKEASRDLDDWFKDDKWSKMPTSVKMVMISLYCKVGFEGLNDQKTKDFMSMKSLLEDGKWKDAAERLERTDWAKKYPSAAKDLIEALKNP